MRTASSSNTILAGTPHSGGSEVSGMKPEEPPAASSAGANVHQTGSIDCFVVTAVRELCNNKVCFLQDYSWARCLTIALSAVSTKAGPTGRPAPARLPGPQHPRRPTTRPVSVARLHVGHRPLLLCQPGAAHLPLLQVRPLGQGPRPLGRRHQPELLRRGAGPVPTAGHPGATTGVATAPEQRRGTRSPRVGCLYNHLSPARILSPTR